MVLKLLSTIHLTSVVPILCYVIRIQIFGTFFKSAYPSKLHVFIYALTFFIIGILILYFCYDSLGSLIGVIGACFGFVLMYFVPIIINIIYYRRKHPPLGLIKEIEETKMINNCDYDKKSMETIDGNIDIQERNISSGKSNAEYAKCDRIDDSEQNDKENKEKQEKLISNFEQRYTHNDDLDLKDKFIYTGKDRNIMKDYFFYFGQFVMLFIGLAIMIFQFYTWNIFKIEIVKVNN